MINEIKKDAQERMVKSLESLGRNLASIRTGRAHPSILDSVKVPAYGSDMPLNQVAAISVEDARTLKIVAHDKTLSAAIEKAIMTSDLGLNPSSAGTTIRVPMPALTEERRRDLIKVIKHEGENAKVAIRNLRRDAISHLKDALKKKEIAEDDERKALDDMQRLTDRYVAEVDRALAEKEKDLMAI